VRDEGSPGSDGVTQGDNDADVKIQWDSLQQEVARLKVDKLELLRQNVAAQREVKRLREREHQLSGDLSLASREIARLRHDARGLVMERRGSHHDKGDSDWDSF